MNLTLEIKYLWGLVYLDNFYNPYRYLKGAQYYVGSMLVSEEEWKAVKSIQFNCLYDNEE